MLAQVEKKLGKMKSEAPKALKNALNQTAKHNKKSIQEAAEGQNEANRDTEDRRRS